MEKIVLSLLPGLVLVAGLMAQDISCLQLSPAVERSVHAGVAPLTLCRRWSGEPSRNGKNRCPKQDGPIERVISSVPLPISITLTI
jgi:hypothetical protein